MFSIKHYKLFFAFILFSSLNAAGPGLFIGAEFGGSFYTIDVRESGRDISGWKVGLRKYRVTASTLSYGLKVGF